MEGGYWGVGNGPSERLREECGLRGKDSKALGASPRNLMEKREATPPCGGGRALGALFGNYIRSLYLCEKKSELKSYE